MLAAALLTASLAASADADTALKLADHPTSKSTAFPAVHSARALRDRVYFGYGDWEAYTATTSVSYDPATNLLAVEHSVSSDSIGMMREIDDTLYIPHCDPMSNTSLMLGMTGSNPGFPPSAESALAVFDGKSSRILRNRIQGFAVTETEVFVLTNRTIQQITNQASSSPTYTPLDITGLPANPTSLELFNGRFYIGTLSGEIWVAAADGSEISVSPPTVEHRTCDQFGRGLAFSGQRLLVGAPDHSSTLPLAGRAAARNGMDATGARFFRVVRP